MEGKENMARPDGPGCEASPSAADGVFAQSHPSRWRFWLIFPLVIVGSCWMLLLDTVRGLLQAVHRASFNVLMAVIKWGARDSDGPRMAETLAARGEAGPARADEGGIAQTGAKP